MLLGICAPTWTFFKKLFVCVCVMCACGSQRLTLSLFLHDLDLFFRTGFSLSGAHSFSKAHQGASLGIHLSPFPQCPDLLLFSVVPSSAPHALHTESSPPLYPSICTWRWYREGKTGMKVVLSAGQKWSWCFWLILVPSSHVCCSLSIRSVAFSKSKSRRNKKTRQQSYNMPVSLRPTARLWADWDAKLIF